MPDLIVERKSRRSYPHSNIASQVIGFTNTDDSGLVGSKDNLKNIFQVKMAGLLSKSMLLEKQVLFIRQTTQNKIQMMGQIFNLLLTWNIRAFFRKNCKEE
ncbi:MAG: hypothetical protein Ct9H90mP7_3610 [Candidatus Neomarinimicrobiota bacterium]|nr:MAG: hypothetical protein Ct9H90mP7_3610 [Candidatus Neomarinimicrobiota bacterium]